MTREWTLRRTATRAAAIVAVTGLIASSLGGCGIEPDAAPRDVAADQRGLTEDPATVVDPSSGDARIYLLAPSESGQQRQIRSVQRDVLPRPDPLLASLLLGPSQREVEARLQTAIPSGTAIVSTRTAGNVLFVDLSEEINELTGEQLTLAVAQIVFTAAEVPGVQVVRLRVNGEEQPWPNGDGQSQTGDLRIYDYPGFAESAQPAFPSVPA